MKANAKNNAMFAEMLEKLNAYEAGCREFEDAKHDVVEAYGYGSDEMHDFYDTHSKPQYPLTGGQSKAFRLVYHSDSDELMFDDFVWESEAHDFIDTLRRLGAKSIVVTNQSTALMENMHWFVAEGCTLEGLCTVEVESWCDTESKMAVRFTL